MEPKSIDSLPLEIRGLILSELTSVTSLKAAIASHAAFRFAFSMRPKSILRNVLTHVVTPALLPEAVAVYEAGISKIRSRGEVEEVMESYIARSKGVAPVRELLPSTISEAMVFERVYEHVSYFAERFASSALKKAHSILESTASPAPVSLCEQVRIKRALYRFHLYCLLCRELDRGYLTQPLFSQQQSSLPSQVDDFVLQFSVWEREQIASVSDFLFKVLEQPFKELAAHDLWWAMQGVQWMNLWPHYPESNFWKCHFLSCGLDFLYKVHQAKTYDERSRILTPELGLQQAFLPKWLQWDPTELDQIHNGENGEGDSDGHSDDDNDDVVSVDDNVTDNTHRAISNDPDPGPELAFFQFHKDDYHCHRHPGGENHGDILPDDTDNVEHKGEEKWIPSGAPRFRVLRLSGYVMWDHSRIVNELNNLVHPEWVARQQPRQLTREEFQFHQDARSSMYRRRQLYLRGARGWWSKDDESRLRWTGKDVSSRFSENPDMGNLHVFQPVMMWSFERGSHSPSPEPVPVD